MPFGNEIFQYSTCEPELQRIRLQPAVALAEAGITPVVWAEDALAFVHGVPTYLFALQLIVPDSSLSRARDIITSTGYFDVFQPSPADAENPLRFRQINFEEAFPGAIHLRVKKKGSNVPDTEKLQQFYAVNLVDILLHPASYWDFPIDDTAKTFTNPTPLGESFSKIRFPTGPAFLDGLAAMYLTPPDPGNFQRELQLTDFLSYLELYTLSEDGSFIVERDDGTEELSFSFMKTLEEADEANRYFLERLALGLTMDDGGESQKRRLDVLNKRGRFPKTIPWPQCSVSKLGWGMATPDIGLVGD